MKRAKSLEIHIHKRKKKDVRDKKTPTERGPCLSIQYYQKAGRPGSSEVPGNPLTRWDVSSIPADGIFSLKN